MKKFALALAVLTVGSSLYAGPFGFFRKSNNNTQPTNNTYQQARFPVAHAFLGSAQGAANYMASICRMGHFGGNNGYEGVGVGSTPYAAEMNCCYRNRWNPREVGLAQGSNGLWYACCRY